jgi:hypothetical protein
MASNKELTDEALALGKELSIEVVTQGLNNAGLQELVDGLKAKRPSAEPTPTAAQPEAISGHVAPSPPAPPPIDGAAGPYIGGPPGPNNRVTQRYNHQVAEGKAVTTRRGMIGAFEPVTADDFGGGDAGKKQLLALVASGHVSAKS